MCKCKVQKLLLFLIKHLFFHAILTDTTSVLSSSHHPQPRIWITGYVKEDAFQIMQADEEFQSKNYENEFVTKNGSEIIISGSMRSVIFTCEASYPIEWNFPFPMHLKSLRGRGISSKEYRISKFSEDMLQPVNMEYRIMIRLRFDLAMFFSANLTCTGTERQPELQSSIFIHLTDRSSLENEGQTLNITAETSSGDSKRLQPITLPCRPSSPSQKLLLENQSISYQSFNNGTEKLQKKWTRVNGDNLSFDPKVGFTIPRVILGNQTFGFYRCSLAYTNDKGEEFPDGQKFVIFNVAMSINKHNESSLLVPRSVLQGKARVYIQIGHRRAFRYPGPHIVCCSGVNDNQPKLYVRFCIDKAGCEMVRNTMRSAIDPEIWLDYSEPFLSVDGNPVKNSTDRSSAILYGPDTLVMCRGENVEYADEYLQTFRPEMDGPVENRSERVKASNMESDPTKDTIGISSHKISLSKFETGSVAKNSKNVAERMVIMLGHVIPNMTFDPKVMAEASPVKFGQVNESINTGLSSFATEMEMEEMPLVVYWKEYDRDVYYNGEHITFMCFGVKSFYSYGPRMRLNWKNGTKTILNPRVFQGWKEIRFLFLSGNGVMFDNMGDDLVSIFSASVVATHEMSSVDCWMPSKDTSRWDKISRSLQVEYSVSPKFTEEEEESAYFYLGNLNKGITCTVTDGAPVPELTVTKDGLEQTIKWNSKSEIGTQATQTSGLENGTRLSGTVSEDKHLLKLDIEFDMITLVDASVWKCIATNVNRTVIRTMKVFVIESRSMAVPISLAIAGLVLMIVIGLGLKYWRDRRNA